MRRDSWRSVPITCNRPGRTAAASLGILRIAAEQDVDAASGHIGRDGHRAATPGLGDELGLLLVVLGVQQVERMFSRRRSSPRISFFSMDAVPTSTGWPLARRS